MSFTPFLYSQKTRKQSPLPNSGIAIASPEHSTIELVFDGVQPGSVQCWWNGTKQTIENRYPWRVGGDAGELKWKVGENKLSFSAYSKPQGKGSLLLNKTITINVAAPAPLPEVVRLNGKGLVFYGSDDLIASAKILKECNIDRARWWMSTEFTGRVSPSWASQAKAWKSQSTIKRIIVTATVGVNSGVIPAVSDVKEWAKSFASTCAGAIDAVQVLNEVNLNHYFAGTIQQAADICAAVADCLAGSGIQTIASSISRDTKKLKELFDTGIGSKVYGFAFHSYGPNADEHINGYAPDPKLKGLKGAREIVGEMPLIQTETGLHAGSFSGWRAEMPKAWQGSKAYINESYLYRLIANGQPAGKFGLVNKQFLRNPETYETWRKLA